MIIKKLLFIALILATFASCKKDKETTSDTTNVLMYTNAHCVVNGILDFNVEVYLDEKHCGTLKTCYSPTKINIPCDAQIEDSVILKVAVEKGKHIVKANSDCASNMERTKEINVTGDDCQTIFIDYVDFGV